jgi:hypothetical protein
MVVSVQIVKKLSHVLTTFGKNSYTELHENLTVSLLILYYTLDYACSSLKMSFLVIHKECLKTKKVTLCFEQV